MQALTTTLTISGTALILVMWGMNQIQRINPMSLLYIGCMAAGFLMLIIAMFTSDADTFAFNNWAFQILSFIGSIWLMKFLFKRK